MNTDFVVEPDDLWLAKRLFDGRIYAAKALVEVFRRNGYAYAECDGDDIHFAEAGIYGSVWTRVTLPPYFEDWCEAPAPVGVLVEPTECGLVAVMRPRCAPSTRR